MAAGEDELQALVRDDRLVHGVLRGLPHVEQANLRRERAIAADAVDRAVARGGHQPGARVGRRPVAGPALGGDRKRVLRGFLRELEVAEEADQDREDTPPLVAEGARHRPGSVRARAMATVAVDRYHSAIGRTSTAPPMRAAGTRDASSIAASRSSASNRR